MSSKDGLSSFELLCMMDSDDSASRNSSYEEEYWNLKKRYDEVLQSNSQMVLRLQEAKLTLFKTTKELQTQNGFLMSENMLLRVRKEFVQRELAKFRTIVDNLVQEMDYQRDCLGRQKTYLDELVCQMDSVAENNDSDLSNPGDSIYERCHHSSMDPKSSEVAESDPLLDLKGLQDSDRRPNASCYLPAILEEDNVDDVVHHNKVVHRNQNNEGVHQSLVGGFDPLAASEKARISPSSAPVIPTPAGRLLSPIKTQNRPKLVIPKIRKSACASSKTTAGAGDGELLSRGGKIPKFPGPVPCVEPQESVVEWDKENSITSKNQLKDQKHKSDTIEPTSSSILKENFSKRLVEDEKGKIGNWWEDMTSGNYGTGAFYHSIDANCAKQNNPVQDVNQVISAVSSQPESKELNYGNPSSKNQVELEVTARRPENLPDGRQHSMFETLQDTVNKNLHSRVEFMDVLNSQKLIRRDAGSGPVVPQNDSRPFTSTGKNVSLKNGEDNDKSGKGIVTSENQTLVNDKVIQGISNFHSVIRDGEVIEPWENLVGPRIKASIHSPFKPLSESAASTGDKKIDTARTENFHINSNKEQQHAWNSDSRDSKVDVSSCHFILPMGGNHSRLPMGGNHSRLDLNKTYVLESDADGTKMESVDDIGHQTRSICPENDGPVEQKTRSRCTRSSSTQDLDGNRRARSTRQSRMASVSGERLSESSSLGESLYSGTTTPKPRKRYKYHEMNRKTCIRELARLRDGAPAHEDVTLSGLQEQRGVQTRARSKPKRYPQ